MVDAVETIDLSWIIPDSFENDDREPLFTFNLPGAEGDYGFFAPSILFWVELLSLLTFQSLLVAALSTIMFKFIIRRQGEPVCYLVGYGIVIPILLIFPYYEISALGIYNKILKFSTCAVTTTLTLFHCTEAMYGFQPKHASTSMRSYALYCGSPMELVYDSKQKKHIRSTIQSTVGHLKSFGMTMILLGVYQSLLHPSAYVPFSSVHTDTDWNSLSRMFDPQQLKTNLTHALLFQLYLTLFSQGLAAATCVVLGREPGIMMRNPVLESMSPSEFWGKRWNVLVHGVLKRGVFKPFRRFFSKPVAVAAVFLASGLFHEWILTVVFLRHPHELDSDGSCSPPKCHNPPYGGQTGFMMWNAIVLTLEYLVGGWFGFTWIKKNLPSPAVSIMVVALGLPVVHWFCHPYTSPYSDFFNDGTVALPMIKKL